MALHYFYDYERFHQTRNFGDSINPMLCRKLFHKSIIDNPDLCILGVGTILNNQNIKRVGVYDKKVVFSSGMGYGDFTLEDDSSWEFVCVRGPLTAEKIGLPLQAGICDGAILLADMYPPIQTGIREGILLIPHVNTIWSSGKSLEHICKALGIELLSPSAPFDYFISKVQKAKLVITEAMHGAILADAMRTPWIPFDMRDIELFKWKDWFSSMDIEEFIYPVKPMLYDNQFEKSPIHLYSFIKALLKNNIVKSKVKKIADNNLYFLSHDDVWENKIQRLRERVEYINDKYST